MCNNCHIKQAKDAAEAHDRFGLAMGLPVTELNFPDTQYFHAEGNIDRHTIISQIFSMGIIESKQFHLIAQEFKTSRDLLMLKLVSKFGSFEKVNWDFVAELCNHIEQQGLSSIEEAILSAGEDVREKTIELVNHLKQAYLNVSGELLTDQETIKKIMSNKTIMFILRYICEENSSHTIDRNLRHIQLLMHNDKKDKKKSSNSDDKDDSDDKDGMIDILSTKVELLKQQNSIHPSHADAAKAAFVGGKLLNPVQIAALHDSCECESKSTKTTNQAFKKYCTHKTMIMMICLE